MEKQLQSDGYLSREISTSRYHGDLIDGPPVIFHTSQHYCNEGFKAHDASTHFHATRKHLHTSIGMQVNLFSNLTHITESKIRERFLQDLLRLETMIS